MDQRGTDAAYEATLLAFRPGITAEQRTEHYNNWAEDYEKHCCPGVYNAPYIAVDAVTNYYGDDRSAKILDVAAGTGLVGFELWKRGFRSIDALDPAKAMLDKAADKKVYAKLFNCSVGEECDGLIKGSYDCVVLAGGMGEGHVPCSALRDMIDLPRPGGLVCIVMREEFLNIVQGYANQLEPEMERLEHEGKWRRLSRYTVPEYAFGKTGVVYQYVTS